MTTRIEALRVSIQRLNALAAEAHPADPAYWWTPRQQEQHRNELGLALGLAPIDPKRRSDRSEIDWVVVDRVAHGQWEPDITKAERVEVARWCRGHSYAEAEIQRLLHVNWTALQRILKEAS